MAGYKSVTVRNSKDVYEVVCKQEPVGILLNLGFPDMEGGSVIPLLKSNQATVNIPVIVLSANIDVRIVADKVGANLFIEKPFDINFLIEAIQKHFCISEISETE